MKRLGLQCVRRGKVVCTIVGDGLAPYPLGRVNRVFKANRPNQRWVSELTYVSKWRGWLCVAFVMDVMDVMDVIVVNARCIVGSFSNRFMHTDFVLDALEKALYDYIKSADQHGVSTTS